MEEIEIGQEREFFERVEIDQKVIEKGTRIRVGYIEEEVMETEVTVVVLGTQPPQTLRMPRRMLTLYSLPVGKGS